MPPNPDVKQLRVGSLVTLVLVRDREAHEYKLVIAEHGLVARRTEIPLQPDQAAVAAKFLGVPLYPERSIVTDSDPRGYGGVVEIPMDEDDDPTKPER